MFGKERCTRKNMECSDCEYNGVCYADKRMQANDRPTWGTMADYKESHKDNDDW